jgi:hypothetical protein
MELDRSDPVDARPHGEGVEAQDGSDMDDNSGEGRVRRVSFRYCSPLEASSRLT